MQDFLRQNNFRNIGSPSLPPVPQFYISKDLLIATKKLLLSYSKPSHYHEGVVYWAGIKMDSIVFVTTALTPKATTTSGSFHVGVIENAEVVEAISKLQLRLIAQIHSHPFKSGVGHSAGDERMAFMPFNGFLSIVVKDYALNGLVPFSETGVHVFYKGEFHRLPKTEVQKKFHILPLHIELRRQSI